MQCTLSPSDIALLNTLGALMGEGAIQPGNDMNTVTLMQYLCSALLPLP